MKKSVKALIIIGCIAGSVGILVGADAIYNVVKKDSKGSRFERPEGLDGVYDVIGSEAKYKGERVSNVSGRVAVLYSMNRVDFDLTYLDSYNRNVSFNLRIDNLIGFDGSSFAYRDQKEVHVSKIAYVTHYTENYEFIAMTGGARFNHGDDFIIHKLLLEKTTNSFDDNFKLEGLSSGATYKQFFPLTMNEVTLDIRSAQFTREDKTKLTLETHLAYHYSREANEKTFVCKMPEGQKDYDSMYTLYGLTDKFYIYTVWSKENKNLSSIYVYSAEAN